MKLSLPLFLSYFAAETEAYGRGAPAFRSVLEMLQPGGPHTSTYQQKDNYSYSHHQIRLGIKKTGEHMAQVRSINNHLMRNDR